MSSTLYLISLKWCHDDDAASAANRLHAGATVESGTQHVGIPGAEFPQQRGHLQLVLGHDAEGGLDGHRVRSADVEPHVADDVVAQSTVEGHIRFVLVVEELIRGHPCREKETFNDGM